MKLIQKTSVVGKVCILYSTDLDCSTYKLRDIGQINLDSLSLSCFISQVATQLSSLIPVISKMTYTKHLVIPKSSMY